LLKLFRHLKHYRLLIALVIGLTIIQIGTELVLPTLMANIVDVGIVNKDMSYILRIGVVMLVVALLGAAAAVLTNFCSVLVSEGFGRTLRDQIYAKVEGLSLSAFQSVGDSSLITRTTNDVTQVQNIVQLLLRVMLLAPIMCIGGIIMALSQDVKLSLVLLISIPLLIIALSIIVWNAMPLFKSIQKRIDMMNQVIREGLSGIRVIRAFHRTNWEKKRFEEANFALRDNTIQVQKIMSLNLPVIMLAFNLSTVLILWFGTERIVDRDLQVGELMAFIQYASMILLSVVLLSFLFGALPRAMASASRIQEVLSLEVEKEEEDSEQVFFPEDVPLTVEFRQVSYRYPEANRMALKDISFSTQQGEITAIIGKTGVGKTTLLNLLPRLLEVESGQILIGGVDSKQIPFHQLRGMIGIVPQKSILFSRSIADNIRYGNPMAQEETIREAASTAQAALFIEEKEDGYESIVSQGGSNLSGGQKQRLAIARALARKPRIYLFDDSFSALDYKTDAKLRRAIRAELNNAVVLIVAQRVRTVIDADRIIVLEDGEIAAVGTHAELLQSSEVYQEIVKSQETGEASA